MGKELKEILKEQMQAKGLTFEKIKLQTGIAERYLMAFLEGQKDKLPAAPYVRGYLMTIAAILELNGKELWETYKDELTIKKSGPNDRMPINRFALKKASKNKIVIGLLVIFLIVYFTINANKVSGRPNLQIANPPEATLTMASSTINLFGTVDVGAKLTIDGDEVLVDSTGHFQKIYALQPGLNLIEFSAKNLLGKEAKATRQVIYQP